LEKISTTDTVLRFIENWLEIEIYIKKRYALLAEHTDNVQAKAVFNQRSSAGDKHAKILQKIREILMETGEVDKEVTLSISLRILEESKPQKWEINVKDTYHAMKSHL